MVDAYQDITIPFQMSSKEFFELVKAHLKPNGVMVVNMNMRSKESDGINSYLSDTIASCFDNVYTVDVPNVYTADVYGATNRELFASCSDDMISNFTQRAAETENSELYELMSKVNDSLVPYKGGDLILTDDKAPVELLGMSVIDDLIQDELVYYRERFKEEGIHGVIG